MHDQDGNEIEPPKIIFPCDYPIKVMGSAGDELREVVFSIMNIHAPGYDLSAATVRDSNKGNYQSLTVTITATGKSQLEAIFNDLKKSSHVKMVL